MVVKELYKLEKQSSSKAGIFGTDGVQYNESPAPSSQMPKSITNLQQVNMVK